MDVRWVIGGTLIAILLLSFTGHVLIFSNMRVLDFAHRELSYRSLANRLTDATDPATITRDTIKFVSRNVFLPSNTPVIDDDPWDVLLRGNGYCDQMNQLAAALLEKQGITAHWTALRKASGDEPHAVLEVLRGDRWEVFDPLFDTLLLTPTGNVATISEICADPSIITNNSYFRAT
ncbi:MAG TPA: transglutaminase-like domain-containing protein, partial [Candidatus Nanoarchaeia archaeon]|nr:transglutaminase-like domain-containing protein [Candidatus Nanoarchaeia archaeon]